jgi:hypothetical protein
LPAGRQQRVSTGAGTCVPGQRAACEHPRHWSHRRPLPGKSDVRRCRAHVVRRKEPSREPGCALVGTDMIKVSANRKPLPAADGC